MNQALVHGLNIFNNSSIKRTSLKPSVRMPLAIKSRWRKPCDFMLARERLGFDGRVKSWFSEESFLARRCGLIWFNNHARTLLRVNFYFKKWAKHETDLTPFQLTRFWKLPRMILCHQPKIISALFDLSGSESLSSNTTDFFGKVFSRQVAPAQLPIESNPIIHF